MTIYWGSEGWNIIYTISTAVMALAIIITAYLALGQLKEIVKSRQLDAFRNLIQTLQNEDIREARRILLEKLSKKEFGEWTEDERKQAERACHTYDTAGMMCLNKIHDNRFVVATWHNSIIKCRKVCEPMIVQYRKERGEDFWDNFDKLYKMARKYEETRKAK